jgi:competence protein ComEC
MVISGAHIGLIIGMTYTCVKWLWSRMAFLCLRLPAARVASCVAFLMGLIYALIAGFAAPAQRAVVVSFFMLLPNVCSQRIGVWLAWRYALLAVILFEPHSVMMPGFYLSFIAVAILIAVNQRFLLKGIRKTLVMQLACLLGLMPLTLFWFSYGAVNGLVANLLAIPWVSFIIVPLGLWVTLCGNMLTPVVLFSVLTHAIDYLLSYLQWVNSWDFLNLQLSWISILSPIALMVAIILMFFLPMKRFMPVMLVIVIGAIFPAYGRVKTNDAIIDVLDVGQGLAVVIRTAEHTLIYDTGVKFYQGGDMGKLAIIPYLKAFGIKNLDAVIISHPDLDHRGGLESLEQEFKIKQLIVDDTNFYHRGVSCHHYPDWQWDGITFHFFPITTVRSDKNNASCVLQILNTNGQVLLTGDIEQPAEAYLANQYGQQLASNVLVVPHHGSKTSSSARFLDAVLPQYAIVSYGFDNRYHFPHPQVIDAYQARDITMYNTVDCGAVSIQLSKLNGNFQPVCFRKI